MVFAVAFLAGCSGLSGQRERPGADTRVEPSGRPDGITSPQISVPDRPTRVAILLSDDVAPYQEIAAEIRLRGQQNEYLTVSLAGRSNPATDALQKFHDFDPDKIVAVGLPAAKAGRDLSDRPMVFCQVFNYQDHDLLTTRTKGVKLLPPFSMQVAIWKGITPNLRTLGVITGPEQNDLLAEIQQAAAQHRVELLVRTVTTDKEALFEFKHLTPQIQGFWLLPDNRVLSPRVLREILSYSNKHGIQTAVFNRHLLDLGADISFSSNEADIADAVVGILGGAGSKDLLFGPPMTPLTTVSAAVKREFYAALRSRGHAPEELRQYPSDR